MGVPGIEASPWLHAGGAQTAVILDAPAASAVASPVWLIAMAIGCDELHNSCGVIAVPAVSTTSAASCCVELMVVVKFVLGEPLRWRRMLCTAHTVNTAGVLVTPDT